ncbi:class I SAM-dependent methyltransferase [Propionivibrio sp.]|uniref:class I SAM-dependent methyltransferase n=1 Tax=Propionivibrio sp. TaxID=2212460 RepID=UPI00261E319F|nr:class I SAM-dependent methyltransferase [Propionivibrio sp.]
MLSTPAQSQKSVESFSWQWTKQTVIDSTRTFHRRLFTDCGLWFDHHDDKVIADVCSGNGRHVWALANMTKAVRIISVELAQPAAALQRQIFAGEPRVEVIQGDAGLVEFEADFIYLLGAIQHVEDPLNVLKRVINNLNDRGELVVSFYMVTPATMALEPIRSITKRLPKSLLWALSPVLAPLFMVRKAGREMGFKNARHTAYDWFGSHQYQRYFTEPEIFSMFEMAGIDPSNIIKLGKGFFKLRAGEGARLDDTIHTFGADAK